MTTPHIAWLLITMAANSHFPTLRQVGPSHPLTFVTFSLLPRAGASGIRPWQLAPEPLTSVTRSWHTVTHALRGGEEPSTGYAKDRVCTKYEEPLESVPSKLPVRNQILNIFVHWRKWGQGSWYLWIWEKDVGPTLPIYQSIGRFETFSRTSKIIRPKYNSLQVTMIRCMTKTELIDSKSGLGNFAEFASKL